MMQECPDLESLRGYLTGGYAFCGADADEIVATMKKVKDLELQNRALRRALESSDWSHSEMCKNVNSHPQPDIENCRCWQKIKHDALAGPGRCCEGYGTHGDAHSTGCVFLEKRVGECAQCGGDHRPELTCQERIPPNGKR